MPEIDEQVRPEIREELCTDLDGHLNELFDSRNFPGCFTLPFDSVSVGRSYRGEKYDGILTSIGVGDDVSLKDGGLKKNVFKDWKQKIFAPYCKFLAENSGKYFIKK
jgi:hypothetical protein